MNFFRTVASLSDVPNHWGSPAWNVRPPVNAELVATTQAIRSLSHVKRNAAAKLFYIDAWPVIPGSKVRRGLAMCAVEGLERIPRGLVLDRVVVKVGGRNSTVDFTLDDEVAFSQVEEGLRRYLVESHGWFTGGAVTVNVGRRVLNSEELGRLRHLFEEEFQLKVARFWCRTERLENVISEEAGLPVELVPRQRTHFSTGQRVRTQDQPLYVKGTCRSGKKIHYNGDVVIRGDVNPGAQVTAAGDIIILGTLRGIAHAGNTHADPARAVIIALALQPLQLRIGRHVCVAPRDKGRHSRPTYPEIAYVSGQSIVVAPFTGKIQSLQERNFS